MRNSFGIIFILNVKIWKIFWTSNLLTKRKKFKIKKSSRRDNFNSSAFFTPNPIQYLKNAFGIILISYLKIWKYYGLFIAYKSIVNGKSRKSSRRDKNAYLCLPSHLGSWIQKGLLPIRFHIRMENFLTKNISFKLKLVYKKSVFSKSSRRDI